MNTPMNNRQVSKSVKGNKPIDRSNLSSVFTKKCLDTSLPPMSTSIDKNTKASKAAVKRSDEKSFSCYMCEKSFPTQSEVIMHLKFIHNACATRDCSRIADVRLHSPVCQNRPFDCSVCYKKFSEKYLLQMHFNQHINAAFFICDICRDGFQQRKELQKHMLDVHEKNVTIPVTPSCTKRVYQKCMSCLKYFQLFSEYEDHSFVCNSPKHVCGICKVDFSNLLTLESHEEIEHKEGAAVKGFLALKEGKRYFCGICYLGFTKGDILREHLKTHEKKEIINEYLCDECHSSFDTDEELQSHYLNHIEEHYVLQDVIRQHFCEMCKMTFKTQKELIDHSDSGICKKTNTCNEMDSHTGNLNNNEDQLTLPDKQKEDLSINNKSAAEKILESDIFGSKPSDFPVYALKAGDELVNCDDSNCIIVIDRDSLFVLQRGICASECRMPDVSNAEAYNDTDVIDASLLQNHMLNILNVKDDETDENVVSSEVSNEALSVLEQKLNIDSDSSEVLTINLSELNAQLASDPAFKNHQIFIESIPMNECENSEVSHTYKIIVDDTLENIESNQITSELTTNEAINHENKVPYVNELVKDAVAQNPDLVKMT